MSRKDFVAIAKQTGGLKVANLEPDYFPPVTKASLSPDRQKLNLDETLGGRMKGKSDNGTVVYKGDLELAFRPISAPLILSAFFGSPVSTELSPAPVVGSHVFDPLAVGKKPTPLTITTVNADTDPAIVDTYIGAICDEIELSVETNDFLMIKAGFLAASLDQSQEAPVATRDASQRFPFQTITAKIGVPSINAGALATIPLGGFSLKAKNNLGDDDFVLGSDELFDIEEGNLDVEVEFTPRSDVPAHYRRALAETPELCRLVLTAEGATITGVHKNKFEIDLKSLEYVEAPVEIDGSKTLKDVTVKANVVLDDAAVQALVLTVVNGDAGASY